MTDDGTRVLVNWNNMEYKIIFFVFNKINIFKEIIMVTASRDILIDSLTEATGHLRKVKYGQSFKMSLFLFLFFCLKQQESCYHLH